MDFPPPPPREGRKPSSSSGCLKWGLIGCGGGLGLFLLVAFGIGFYISRHSKDIVATADRNAREAIAVARHSDEKGCVDAASQRMEKSGVISGGVSGAMFLEACLRSSQPTPGFCDDVPPKDEFTRSSAWQQKRCARVAMSPGDNIRCNAVSGVVQRYCTEEGRAKLDPDSAVALLDSMSAALSRRGTTR
jgi:hypothetical protein